MDVQCLLFACCLFIKNSSVVLHFWSMVFFFSTFLSLDWSCMSWWSVRSREMGTVRLVLVWIFSFLICNSVESLYLIWEFLTIGVFPVSRFIRSTISFFWIPWPCKRSNYSTGWLAFQWVDIQWFKVNSFAVFIVNLLFIIIWFLNDSWFPQLKNHPEIYDGYVPMGYVDYIKKMSKYVPIFVFIAFYPKPYA